MHSFRRKRLSHTVDRNEDEIGSTRQGEEEGDPANCVRPACVSVTGVVIGTRERSQAQHEGKSCKERVGRGKGGRDCKGKDWEGERGELGREGGRRNDREPHQLTLKPSSQSRQLECKVIPSNMTRHLQRS